MDFNHIKAGTKGILRNYLPGMGISTVIATLEYVFDGKAHFAHGTGRSIHPLMQLNGSLVLCPGIEFEPLVLDAAQQAPAPLPAHDGHEVVHNTVMGKQFKYCRNCKVEV